MALPDTPEWHLDAACRGMDQTLFFPKIGQSIRLLNYARAVCSECPVATQCLAWAIEHRERYGIWGGLTERQRRVVRRAAS